MMTSLSPLIGLWNWNQKKLVENRISNHQKNAQKINFGYVKEKIVRFNETIYSIQFHTHGEKQEYGREYGPVNGAFLTSTQSPVEPRGRGIATRKPETEDTSDCILMWSYFKFWETFAMHLSQKLLFLNAAIFDLHPAGIEKSCITGDIRKEPIPFTPRVLIDTTGNSRSEATRVGCWPGRGLMDL